MKLNGKLALITGAASGIGHAIAKRYVEADGRVVIADLDPTKAAQAASELGDKKTQSASAWMPLLVAEDPSVRFRTAASRRSHRANGHPPIAT
jgi:NAD(P)-dependent dehydrogenase (short-subunit alcohol dehydrogenase family)